MDDLKQANANRWQATCARMGVSHVHAETIWSQLSTAYSERSRHYHTLQHIDQMLGWLDLSEPGTDALEIAIWFHDCVYDPMAQNNEAQSANAFTASLGGCLCAPFRQKVTRLILATDVRLPQSEQPDEALMVDIDLSVLSADPAVYAAYASAVRREYSMVLDANFNAGRCAVLQQILSRPVYQTELFQSRESSARRNLEAELLGFE